MLHVIFLHILSYCPLSISGICKTNVACHDVSLTVPCVAETRDNGTVRVTVRWERFTGLYGLRKWDEGNAAVGPWLWPKRCVLPELLIVHEENEVNR